METLKLVPDMTPQWAAIKPSDKITVHAALDRMRATEASRKNKRYDTSGVELKRLQAFVSEGDSSLQLQSGHGITFGHTTVREHAFGQLCTAIGAPASYLRKLPANVAIDCLNHGLRKYEGSKRTFRMAGNQVRAIVSDRYSALDDIPAMEHLANAVGSRELYLTSFAQSATTTICRFVSPQLFDGPDGKPLQIGFDLKNSEVGSYSLYLEGVIYRQVCTNGLVIKLSEGTAQKWRHIGGVDRLQTAFVDTLPHVLSDAEAAVYKVAVAHGLIMTVAEARANWLPTLELPASFAAQSITEALQEAGIAADSANDDTKITAWHLINGVTAAARELVPAARVEMEGAAAKLLKMAA